MIQPQTLKGFRDFLPTEARKRAYVINKLKQVFESFGFDPLETPALEYAEILTGKYGEEGEKLMYKFTDKGDREVALRYDQTVPLARVVAQYQNELPKPFKRYQIQPVWRAENTQKGRYREFLQCDADIIGTDSIESDLEILQCVDDAMKALGFSDFSILVNTRKLFGLFSQGDAVATIVDKEDKIGPAEVINQLTALLGSSAEAQKTYTKISNFQASELPEKFKELLSQCTELGLKVVFSSKLARGLDYYTDLIFEVVIPDFSGSICGGGRYDNLIGMFTKQSIPAVGFAFGFDRLMEAMEILQLLPLDLTTAKILVTVFNKDLYLSSLKLSQALRDSAVNTELYPSSEVKLDKQLKYAADKSIPYVVILGPEEVEKNLVTLKNMQTGEQKQIPAATLINSVTSD